MAASAAEPGPGMLVTPGLTTRAKRGGLCRGDSAGDPPRLMGKPV